MRSSASAREAGTGPSQRHHVSSQLKITATNNWRRALGEGALALTLILLVAERFNRIQLGRPGCREQAEEDAREGAGAEGGHNGEWGNGRLNR